MRRGLVVSWVWLACLGGCGNAPLAPDPFGSSGGSAPAETGAGGGGQDGETGGAGNQPAPAASGGAGGALSGRFELAWEDGFDTVDLTRWELMTHSWDSNLAQFTAENAQASDGILHLSLTAADDPEKPYRGVEMRSRETLTYGKVEVSTRFATGSAVVSSLVLIYTPWPPDDWNELDVEFLGKNTDRVQFNHMINVPPADPETGHLQFPQLVTLPFNPAADFHTFAIEWVPGEARFIVDGTLLHTATEEMARMVLPQNILLTIWASDAADWAGPVDSTTAPTSAEYDWIRVYRYVGPGG
ncbi:MAG: family 16 glycosylhydrolase [Polyangiaceae bacterium]|nr:family 16 glycosylhydrolase [Polyangiaceae bacterium]